LLGSIPVDRTREQIDVLAEARAARIEQVVSQGRASPPGFWYDPGFDE
jgi:cupin 2 domain-containing protein